MKIKIIFFYIYFVKGQTSKYFIKTQVLETGECQLVSIKKKMEKIK